MTHIYWIKIVTYVFRSQNYKVLHKSRLNAIKQIGLVQDSSYSDSGKQWRIQGGGGIWSTMLLSCFISECLKIRLR